MAMEKSFWQPYPMTIDDMYLEIIIIPFLI